MGKHSSSRSEALPTQAEEETLTKISELEGVVIGMVRSRHSCTAYSVRRMLQQSPSAHWSASAGAIYPLLDRLEREGWVKSELDPDDRRGRRLLVVTPDGRKAHRRWMLAASHAEVAANISDAVRTRAFFLSVMSPHDRRQFVDESLEALEAFLKITQQDLEDRSSEVDDLSRLAALGGVRQAEARVAWMREVKSYVDTMQDAGDSKVEPRDG